MVILYPKHCACNKLWYSHNSHNVDISTIIFHVYVIKSTGRDKTEDEKIRIQEKIVFCFGKGVWSMSFMVSASSTNSWRFLREFPRTGSSARDFWIRIAPAF